jgi:hypothetical protein
MNKKALKKGFHCPKEYGKEEWIKERLFISLVIPVT